jgi:protein-tyrosine phosphatase
VADDPVRLLFVCLGNICRSPTAEGVMRSLIDREGLEDEIETDSAGTGAWHVGSAPDGRASAAAQSRGVVLVGTARLITPADFERFDLILAMDGANLRDLRHLADSEEPAEGHRHPEGHGQAAKLRLLREFDPAARAAGELDVPDPYYGPPGGFGEVFEMVSAACEGLLAEIRAGREP